MTMKTMPKIILFLVMIMELGLSLDNGLGKTPPMGWNSWNKFGCLDLNESVIKKTVDQLQRLGLRDKGYIYVNLDDCWQIDRDSITHQIQYDKSKFPSGLQNLIAYVHTHGFKFGLYSDAGTKTCQGRPGSYNYERIDAQTYAKWGVDYLKYDNCHNEGLSPKFRYPLMKNALNETGRPIYFSMCQWGRQKPYEWAQDVANSWRTTVDIKDIWQSFLHNLQAQVGLSKYAGPGNWNDPDMLQVGNGGMSHDQYQSHFALWAVLKSPLLIGCDLANVSVANLEILSNQQIIAINQDPLGKQADRMHQTPVFGGFKQIWGGRLSNKRFVLVFFNRSPEAVKFTLNTKDEWPAEKVIEIRDSLKHINVSVPTNNVIEVSDVKKHASVVYVIKFQ